MENARSKVEDLLENFRSNVDRLERVRNRNTLQEWEKDYLSEGAHESSEIEQKVRESVRLEKQKVLDSLERDHLDVEITQLLLLELPFQEREIVRLRYFHRKKVKEICGILFISKSSFYRKHQNIIDRMAKGYDRLMANA